MNCSRTVLFQVQISDVSLDLEMRKPLQKRTEEKTLSERICKHLVTKNSLKWSRRPVCKG